VEAQEPVGELETDKATTEVMAPAGGTLAITVPEGSKVAVGAAIGRIESGTAAPSTAAPPRRDGNSHVSAAPGRTSAPAEPLLSPAARHVAANEGVDPHQLIGTGRGGRIIKEDVLSHLEQRGGAAEKMAVAPPAPPSIPLAAPVTESKPPKAGRERRERM